MTNPVLFYGNDSEVLMECMKKQAAIILELDSVSALENSPDYLEATPSSKSKSFTYNLETISMLVKQCHLPPYKGKKRVIALSCVERMLPVHVNALLKTLEEMPPYCQIFLTTTRKNDILKTLLSRVQERYVEGKVTNLNYTTNIREIIALLQEKKYDSFLKKIEHVEKEITEKQESQEKKLITFLQNHSEMFLQHIKQKHLINYYSTKMDMLIKKTFNGYSSNIKLKHLLENLFLETQLLVHSNQ